MEAKELVIVIPAYEPNHQLTELIEKLNQFFEGHRMVVVNDGSKGMDDIFSSAAAMPNVTLLEHEQNQGKGAALKTAFRYIQSLEGHHVIVTADSDGQHKPEDIYRVYNFYKKYNHGLVLGSRKFDVEIPARSAFGNNCARALLRLCNGLRLNDTQTGLRAFGDDLLSFMIHIPGNRYEYEMTMLTLCEQRSIEIHEIAIETIYINNNEASHFRPVRDFSRICSVILKYTLPIFIAVLFTVLGFAVLRSQLKGMGVERNLNLLISLGSASVFGMLIHMLMNLLGVCNGNPYVFRNKRKFLYYFSGYILLILINLGMTYALNLWWHSEGFSLAFALFSSLSFLSGQVYGFSRYSVLHEG